MSLLRRDVAPPPSDNRFCIVRHFWTPSYPADIKVVQNSHPVKKLAADTISSFYAEADGSDDGGGLSALTDNWSIMLAGAIAPIDPELCLPAPSSSSTLILLIGRSES